MGKQSDYVASTIVAQGKSKELAEAMTSIASTGSYTSVKAGQAEKKAGDSSSEKPSYSDEELQEIYRASMADAMESEERGWWGEKVLVQEVEGYGHTILSGHGDEKSTITGYDCVSWDEENQTLHIWEMKNWSAKTKKGIPTDNPSSVYGEGAFEERKYHKNIKKALGQNYSDNSAIMNALNNNQVEWHFRVGPDTKVSQKLKDSLQKSGRNVDFRQYSYQDMVDFIT
ncbi:hypothetical protein QUF58_08810 [Anaerolineales bacterium HSG24]|nr:hypothetical protein [Anaerolineales bacterium HSG24]